AVVEIDVIKILQDESVTYAGPWHNAREEKAQLLERLSQQEGGRVFQVQKEVDCGYLLEAEAAQQFADLADHPIAVTGHEDLRAAFGRVDAAQDFRCPRPWRGERRCGEVMFNAQVAIEFGHHVAMVGWHVQRQRAGRFHVLESQHYADALRCVAGDAFEFPAHRTGGQQDATVVEAAPYQRLLRKDVVRYRVSIDPG